jgi:hypothetical protein
MLLYEANNLMLFQGIIESPDIPIVYNHGIVGEGETLPLRPRCFWLRVLTPVLVGSPKRGTFLQIEWSGEVFGSRRRREKSTKPYHLEEGEVVPRAGGPYRRDNPRWLDSAGQRPHRALRSHGYEAGRKWSSPTRKIPGMFSKINRPA